MQWSEINAAVPPNFIKLFLFKKYFEYEPPLPFIPVILIYTKQIYHFILYIYN